MARQCPHCPLLFDLAPMLADHMARDHDVDADQLHHLQPPSRRVGTRVESGPGESRQAESTSDQPDRPGRTDQR
ncbi:hypothetical protein [Euzebya tangerina]|uniref:hypothetical protein n=1 Tax=Euzebya tangerina TaxID=591198 RepID=UPI0013C341DD|nr:hypothetical protein [Euzebya tangerina]